MFRDMDKKGKPISNELKRGPSYDERSGFSVGIGTDYGSGYRVPVGKEGPARSSGDLSQKVKVKKVKE